MYTDKFVNIFLDRFHNTCYMREGKSLEMI